MQNPIQHRVVRLIASGAVAMIAIAGGGSVHADDAVAFEPARELTSEEPGGTSAEIDQTWCSGNLGCAIVAASCTASHGTITVWTNRDGQTHGVCTY